MCAFFFLLFNPPPVSEQIWWEPYQLGEDKRYWPCDKSNIFMETDLLTALQWAQVDVCLCVCVCPSVYIPWGRAWLLCVYVCLCAFPQFKVCCGNPRSSARAKRSRLLSWRRCRIRATTPWKTSGRRRCEEKWKGLDILQPWAKGRLFDSMRLADFTASSQALLYCSKKILILSCCA